jgi:protein-S-isoprenylcysteine O-methyltransferase Ste14
MFYALLIPALWIAWTIYWYAARKTDKAVQRRESVISRAAHIIPLGLAVALFALPDLWRGWLSLRILPFGFVTYWVGVILLVAGLVFTVSARRHLGGNWSGTVTVKRNHELIRTGPYALVRHPIYTGLLLGFIGSAISLGEVRGVVAVALVIVAFMLKIRLEERWMTENFGDAYHRYKKEVSGLIPFVLYPLVFKNRISGHCSAVWVRCQALRARKTRAPS